MLSALYTLFQEIGGWLGNGLFKDRRILIPGVCGCHTKWSKGPLKVGPN